MHCFSENASTSNGGALLNSTNRVPLKIEKDSSKEHSASLTLAKVENDLDLDYDLPWLKYAELNPINSKSQESISSSNTTLAMAPSQTNEDVQSKPNELPSTAASSNHVASKDLVANPIQKTIQNKWLKPCQLCGFEFQLRKSPKQQWSNHFAWHHYKVRIEADLLGSLSCPLCDFVGKSKANIFQHLGGKHKIIEKYISEDISNGTFNQDGTPKTKTLPIKKQRKNSWRPCEICGFKPNLNYKNPSRHRLDHLATHYRDKIELNLLAYQVNFCCPVCEQIQTSKGNLYRHYTRVHRIGEIFLADDIAAGRVKDLKQKRNNSSEVAKNGQFEENINVNQFAEVTKTNNTAFKNVKSVEVNKKAIVTKVAESINVDKFLEVATNAIAIDSKLTTTVQSKPHSATEGMNLIPIDFKDFFRQPLESLYVQTVSPPSL